MSYSNSTECVGAAQSQNGRDKFDEVAMEAHLAESPAHDGGHAAFLAYMSHELRTPLTAIIGFTQVLKMAADHPQFQPDQDEYLDNIDESATRLLHVAETMLSYLESICEKPSR